MKLRIFGRGGGSATAMDKEYYQNSNVMQSIDFGVPAQGLVKVDSRNGLCVACMVDWAQIVVKEEFA